MFQRVVAITLVLLMPTGAIAGPIQDSITKAAQESAAPPATTRSRSTWPGWLLVSGGAALIGFGLAERRGGGSDGAADSDHLKDQSSMNQSGEDRGGGRGVNTGYLIGGAASALVGGLLIYRAHRSRATAIVVAPGRVGVRHSFGF